MDIDLLSKMVRELILDNDKVFLPGLGAFVAEVVPSSFSDKGYTVNPPYRRLSFRTKAEPDSLLADLYAASNGVDAEVAERIVGTFTSEMREVLKSKKVVVFPGLGRLRATKENNFFFVADEDLEIYPEGFGLEPVSLKSHQDVRSPMQMSAMMDDLKSILEDFPEEAVASGSVDAATENTEIPDYPEDESDASDQPGIEVAAEEESSAKASEPASEEVSEDASAPASEESPMEASEEEPEDMASEMSDGAAEPASEEVTEEASEESPAEALEEVPGEPGSAEVTEAASEESPEAVAEEMPETEECVTAVSEEEAAVAGEYEEKGAVEGVVDGAEEAAREDVVDGVVEEAEEGVEEAAREDVVDDVVEEAEEGVEEDARGGVVEAAEEAAREDVVDDVVEDAREEAVEGAGRRGWGRRLAVAALFVIGTAALLLAAYLILAKVSPDFINSILYDPEELEVLKYGGR